MAKSDTWPGGVAMESLTNVDSAGSCDSVISMNSGYVSASIDLLITVLCCLSVTQTVNTLFSGLSSFQEGRKRMKICLTGLCRVAER